MIKHRDTVLDSFLRRGEEFRVLFGQLSDHSAVHAFLITGEKGTGKRTLAGRMGAALLCSSPEEGRPCGLCRNCLLAEKGEHPDLIVIEKGNPIVSGIRKERNTIPVEDIREMIRLCGVRSTDGNMHVVLIFEADRMTQQAQNCLLKTLEEPPPDTCIILVTDHPESLLTTVISRCRPIRMKAWNDDYILSVLLEKGIPDQKARQSVAAADGSIGKALELASEEEYWKFYEEVFSLFFTTVSRSDVLKISNQWKDRKQDADRILSILDLFIGKLAEARFTGGKSDLSFFPSSWKRFAAEADKESFVTLSDAVSNARKQLQYSVNFQAVLERLIFVFMGENNKWQ